MPRKTTLDFHPATPDRWDDIEALFGPRGAMAGCWCMWWRLKRAEFQKNAGAGNRRAFQKIVAGGAVPGILAYDGGRPVGWCAVQPKEAYASLARSRTKTVEAKSTPTGPCWSVTCFYVAKDYRGRGLSRALLAAAVAHARKSGARLVEGYPIDTAKRAMDFSSFMGTAQVFAACGFAEAARPSPNHPIMRREIRR
ncbi:MAG: GNAT family N-acetyltransferase [Alphaproteobacteria bacterium]|nr:GNAT family N-acetyltransferase [Alphaproteobacteria bacterium]